ncbi:SDR family NAD(P)-dependent oxidoreductase [Spirochaeta dissipatitropha]
MKLFVITGGSKGLGKELCNLYRSAGWGIIEFSRTAAAPWSVEIDLSDPEAAERAFSHSFERFSSQHFDEVLAISNAASLQPIRGLRNISAGDIRKSADLNISTALVFFSQVMKHFQGPKLRLASISSGASRHGYAGWSLYCAAKAAMDNAVRALALEEPACEIISIDPGIMDTDMQAEIRASREEDFPAVGKFIQRKERGQLQPAEKIAAAVQTICSLPRLETGEIYNCSDYLEG